jgi:hypothetical protein
MKKWTYDDDQNDLSIYPSEIESHKRESKLTQHLEAKCDPSDRLASPALRGFVPDMHPYLSWYSFVFDIIVIPDFKNCPSEWRSSRFWRDNIEQ